METEYDFIVNPKARSGMGENVWKLLEPELIKRGIKHRVYLTRGRRHAEKIAAGITSDDKEHTIVVLGGDGTVNETVNGIRNLEKVILGYIPIGSSNDFARGMGIPKDSFEALKTVLEQREITTLDIGSVTRQGGREEKTKRFVVSAGMGFDAGVCHEVCVSAWKVILNRIGLGKLSYAAVALDRLKKDRPVRMSFVFRDGTTRRFERTYFAAFMNLRYEGGGFEFCPQASPGDGMLDIIVVHDISPLKILLLLPTAFFGRHTLFKGITVLRCSECSVETEAPMPLHTDGEPGFLRRRIRVAVLKEKLRVIT